MTFKALMLVAAALALPAAVQAQTVVTAFGAVAGRTENGVASWKGVPFAEPPTGQFRWRAPRPAKPWKGVRQATAYGHDCMQLPFPSDAAPLGTQPSEDCLTLNVWKPAEAKTKLPVIVWIYGGGFVNGGSSPPTYSGEPLARQGVVFASFNYRLGRFGAFAHPQLTKADPDSGLLGNYGYMDQLAALKWIKANIAAFGGDPANITIIGESAGGASVNMLVTSPMAKDLFQRAVVMSGGDSTASGGADLAAAEQAGLAFAAGKGVAAEDRQALTKLRALSGEQIVDELNLATPAAAKVGAGAFTGPFSDGKLAVDFAKAYKSGAFSHVPMIIGATSADIGGPTGYMVAGARRGAGVVADQGVPTWTYRFSYVARSIGKTGAQHASDIPYFLDTTAVKYGDKTAPDDIAMGKTISAYLVNFARNGDPNGPSLPTWPRYDRAGDQLMDFSEEGRAIATKDPLAAQIDAATSR